MNLKKKNLYFNPSFSIKLEATLLTDCYFPTDRESMCLATQSCSTLCNPMNSSPRGSSGHGILQARILEWVAISFSKGKHNDVQYYF